MTKKVLGRSDTRLPAHSSETPSPSSSLRLTSICFYTSISNSESVVRCISVGFKAFAGCTAMLKSQHTADSNRLKQENRNIFVHNLKEVSLTFQEQSPLHCLYVLFSR